VITQRFGLAYAGSLRPLFGLLALGPGRSWVEVTEQFVRVRMSWAFRAEIPRSAIRSIEPDHGVVTGWGVHGLGGHWLVNGSSKGMIRLELDPPVRAWMSGFPIRLRVLRVSLEDPESVLRVLARG